MFNARGKMGLLFGLGTTFVRYLVSDKVMQYLLGVLFEIQPSERGLSYTKPAELIHIQTDGLPSLRTCCWLYTNSIRSIGGPTIG